jgi:hypothetical protein
MKLTAEQYRKLQKESNAKLDRLVNNRSGNKLNAKGQYYKGEYYHSTGEMNYAQQLDVRKQAGDIADWRRQVKIDLRVNDIHISNYFIDFVIQHNDGTREYVEYKGYETDAFKQKWKLFLALAPKMFPGAIITKVKHKSKYKPKSTWNKQSKSK